MGMSMADKSRTMSGYDDGCHDEVNPKVTELRLGLPGTEEDEPLPLLSSCLSSSTPSQTGKKRGSSGVSHDESPPPSKAQIIGWPPVRSYRKNSLLAPAKKAEAGNVTGANNNNPHQNNYVKVSMDGAPYLRKIDLKLYKSYQELLKALEDMFDFTMGDYSDRGSEYAPTYEDKDEDWMLVGDVPWNMFVNTCKRLRIMKGGSRR